MKYASTLVTPEAVAELLNDPATEAELLDQLLRHHGDREFTAVVGQRSINVTSSSPIAAAPHKAASGA